MPRGGALQRRHLRQVALVQLGRDRPIRIFRCWFLVVVSREFGYQLLDRVLHPIKLFAVQNATLRILRGELQTSERYLVVIPGQRVVFEQQLGMVLRLICVTRRFIRVPRRRFK